MWALLANHPLLRADATMGRGQWDAVSRAALTVVLALLTLVSALLLKKKRKTTT
jgi:hypothetical protein